MEIYGHGLIGVAERFLHSMYTSASTYTGPPVTGITTTTSTGPETLDGIANTLEQAAAGIAPVDATWISIFIFTMFAIIAISYLAYRFVGTRALLSKTVT